MSDIEIGDIVTVSYKKGYFRVEVINSESRNGRAYKLFEVKQVMKESGNIVNPRSTRTFGEHYLTKITEEVISNYRQHDNEKWDTILRIINPEAEISTDIEMPIGMDLPEPEFLTSLGIPDSLVEKK